MRLFGRVGDHVFGRFSDHLGLCEDVDRTCPTLKWLQVALLSARSRNCGGVGGGVDETVSWAWWRWPLDGVRYPALSMCIAASRSTSCPEGPKVLADWVFARRSIGRPRSPARKQSALARLCLRAGRTSFVNARRSALFTDSVGSPDDGKSTVAAGDRGDKSLGRDGLGRKC